jgi:hypothetical protein
LKSLQVAAFGKSTVQEIDMLEILFGFFLFFGNFPEEISAISETHGAKAGPGHDLRGHERVILPEQNIEIVFHDGHLLPARVALNGRFVYF